MRTFRTLSRLLGSGVVGLVLLTMALGIDAAEAGRITHSFSH